MEENYYPYKDPEVLTYTKKSLKEFHPYKLMLILSLVGVATLFVGLGIAFVLGQGAGWEAVQLSEKFLISTFLLIASSATIHLANYAFKEESNNVFRTSIAATFSLTIAFICIQALAWQDLWNSGVQINSSTSAGYLYMLVGLHGLHVLGGLGFLFLFGIQSLRQVSHPALALVFFTDPHKKLRLKMLTTYWHFIGILWLFLMVLFLGQRLM